MKMQWLGQASFHIVTDDGVAIRTDPYDSSLGFELSALPADIVTISHEHYDHAAFDTVPGDPVLVRGPGEHQVRGITFRGLESFHDDRGGLERGTNTIFTFSADGVVICHLGDLGQLLTSEQIRSIGPVDVLCVPVGGTYTLGAAGATAVMDQLGPRLTVPMHYRVNGLRLPIDGVSPFLRGKANVHTHVALDLARDSLPREPAVVVLTLAVPLSGF